MDINTWLDNWEREADALFQKLENVPPELENEVQKLISWREQARQAADQYTTIRERLWVQRMERRETAARIKVISQKQSKQVEQEISERELAKWQKRLENIKTQIDRVTDNIIREMRRRKRQQLIEAAVWKAAEAADMRRRAEEDLAMWETFKTSLESKQAEEANPSPSPEELEQLSQRRAERKHLKREFEEFQSRPDPNPDEDQSTWNNFIDNL